MVQEYLLNRCKYLAGSLKPFIYLLPKETTRIDYLIDNHKCEVRNVVYEDCIKINGFKTMLTVAESVDNRLDFSTKTTLSMLEDWNETWIELLGNLKKMNCYVVVEDYNGVQYIQTPEFTCAFTYSYTFNSTNVGNIAEISYDCDCNMPVIILDSNIEATIEYDSNCSYKNSNITDFRMTPYRYVLIDSDNETGEFTTITCTGGESMHKVEFTPQTFQFNQKYDGKDYEEKLVFRIPLSDYKYYFRYNLVEFKENRYAILFSTSQNNWIASGFEFGFQPTYTVETSDTVEELNFVEITLYHAGQNTIFFSDTQPIIDTSITNQYVPVTQDVTDPITGLQLKKWECISKTEAIYTLIQMVTLSGVPTDSYMCLEGYEEYYENINIVGTYQSTDQFDFSLTFSNSDCATTDNCEFTKLTKKIMSFASIGDFYDVHIQNGCDWTITNIPSWINCDRLSGSGGVDYVVRFTSRENATSQRKVDFANLQSGDNSTTLQFILEDTVSWINPIEHNITAMNQYVTSYIDLNYNDFTICQSSQGITAEKMVGTSTVRVYVPENSDENNTRQFTVKICDTKNNREATIIINQDHLYTRWEEDVNMYFCDNGNSYKKMRKYKGYTADNINTPTNIVVMGDLILANDPNCALVIGRYRWNTNTGETICLSGDKYTREDYEVSYDNGETWQKTGQYRTGTLVEASSQDCENVQYKWEIDNTRWECDGTTSYYIEVRYESTDGQIWIKSDPEQTRVSQTVRLQNDENCGSSEPIYRWVDDGNNYICEEGDEQPTEETEEWRLEDDSYICVNGSKYRSEIRYYYSNGSWTTDGERRKGTFIESNSTDCVGVQSDTSGKMYLFVLCGNTYECVNNYKIFKATRKRNDDMEGLVWTDDSTNCSIDTRGILQQRCSNFDGDYLTFVALENGTFSFTNTNNNIQYSIDNGLTWQTLTAGSSTPTVTTGNKIMWKGENPTIGEDYGIGSFRSTGRYDVQGNVMSLLYGDNFIFQTDLTGKQHVFDGLFISNTRLINANNLSLPATTLAVHCYESMFLYCTSLTTTPELPATTLANGCYTGMFASCTSLTTAPALPATTLEFWCYQNMFQGCTSLVNAPVLSATTLAEGCYSYMFSGCTSLVNAPALPATTLERYCYNFMFNGCTSLTTAPSLPATTLVYECYSNMFKNCSSLNYIKAMFTTTPNASYTETWVDGVAASGTFVKNSSASWTTTGVNGVPNGWTVQTASE